MWSEYIRLTPEARDKIREIENLTSTQQAVIGLTTAASFALGYKLGRKPRPFQRFLTVQDIPSSYFDRQAPFLRGRVVSVSDGDTLRFLHVPTWFHSSKIKSDQKMSEVALPIRVCSIDTPETAKFGNPGQPFGEEAKQKLSQLTENRTVRVRLLDRDQYSRAVAEVRVGLWPFFKYVDEQMLKDGLAEVYKGGGAVYGRKGKEGYLGLEQAARDRKVGMWSQKDRESASEFKARMKEQTS
jgi:endonuclease YncB( thermonuclease family)